ncbi:sugar dehydrogenase [Gordonibacter sp. 28C]|uniref:glucose 1-dehydrogenase n=1 Tax=Gordonibacter sp. 28C TaxID=2078569 RepID=UPI000DF7EDE8|nr:glucose 1-dehydrogenase [Gordonibacter sp. 28C]RDB62770.1 sugar dehydrogenase [Gordonibacter sp. 28C]
MYPDLNGKTAVVTGASVGLGNGIARRFLQEGMNVVVNYHSDEHRDQAFELVESFGGDGGAARAVAVQADISLEAGAEKLLAAALEQFGGLDVWVNNAGIESRHPTHELPLDVWEKTLAVNLTGVFLGSKAALGHFVERDRPGCIINLSSVHERIPWPTFAHYAASKGGVKLFSETIALEYAHLGIRVNCIAPGAIETPINAEKFADPDARAQTERMIPLGRIGTVEQVAAAAAWLASGESGYVTGTSLFVDGGMALYPSFERGDG